MDGKKLCLLTDEAMTLSASNQASSYILEVVNTDWQGSLSGNAPQGSQGYKAI